MISPRIPIRDKQKVKPRVAFVYRNGKVTGPAKLDIKMFNLPVGLDPLSLIYEQTIELLSVLGLSVLLGTRRHDALEGIVLGI